jgi:peptidoglycan/xylan/chitin deacetylase (PgdA/CDA1 family)
VADAGHEVGNHARTHPDFADPGIDDDELREQLATTSELIAKVTGQRPTHFRPPYGSPFYKVPDHPRGPAIRAQAAALGMSTVIWDITPDDWTKPGRHAIAERVIDHPRVVARESGLVVLLHDGDCADEADGVAALEEIVSQLAERGYTFTTLDGR